MISFRNKSREGEAAGGREAAGWRESDFSTLRRRRRRERFSTGRQSAKESEPLRFPECLSVADLARARGEGMGPNQVHPKQEPSKPVLILLLTGLDPPPQDPREYLAVARPAPQNPPKNTHPPDLHEFRRVFGF